MGVIQLCLFSQWSCTQLAQLLKHRNSDKSLLVQIVMENSGSSCVEDLKSVQVMEFLGSVLS